MQNDCARLSRSLALFLFKFLCEAVDDNKCDGSNGNIHCYLHGLSSFHCQEKLGN